MPKKNNEDENKKLLKKKKAKRKKINRITGIILSSILLLIMALFVGMIMYLGVLPDKYMIALVVVLLLIVLYIFISQFTKAHIIGKVFAIILIIILGFGCFYVERTTNMLHNISGSNTQIDSISIVVLANNPAESIYDCEDYTFAINGRVDLENSNKSINEINEALNTSVSTINYNDWYEMVDALYSGNVDAIILNESFRGILEETYPTFTTLTKVVSTQQFTTVIEMDTPSDTNVIKDSFTVFISGNDSYGNLSSSGRSDVNIIATINPKTKQILLVTTPRDSYLTLYFADGTTSSMPDKLTHAGVYGGVTTSMNTLEHLYGIEIDYYVKINFTGVIELVDALGGITVESDYAFTTYDTTHSFVKGTNYLDGEDALYFVRERYAFPDGDFQRARNQAKVIQALIDKATSPTILTNYADIMSALSYCLETNMSSSQLSKLVKMQLDDMASWTVYSYTVTGESTMAYCYTDSSAKRSIVYVDQNAVTEAKQWMYKVKNGIDPTVEEETTGATTAK